MAFRRIRELDNSKLFPMLGFAAVGLLGLTLPVTPLIVTIMGSNAAAYITATLLNPLIHAGALFFLPVFYLQVLKLFKKWPMEVAQPLQWRLRGLIADLNVALKKFNDYLPVKKIAIISGFFFAIGTAFALSTTPIWVGIFGVHAATYALAAIANFTLRLVALLYLPGLYFQALKYGQIWPMKNDPSPITFNYNALVDDTIKALRSFDWQILNWTSALFLEKWFPSFNEIYLSLKERRYPANRSLLDKFRWLAGEFGLQLVNFGTTLFTGKTLEKIMGETPKNTSSWLFSLGIRERIHYVAYHIRHKNELAQMDARTHEQHLMEESNRFMLHMFTQVDVRPRGFFETIYYAANQEMQVEQPEPRNNFQVP